MEAQRQIGAFPLMHKYLCIKCQVMETNSQSAKKHFTVATQVKYSIYSCHHSSGFIDTFKKKDSMYHRFDRITTGSNELILLTTFFLFKSCWYYVVIN